MSSRDNLLVVDDDAKVRGVLKAYLSLHDLDVTEASDGSDAIRLATKEDYALAIVDLAMPGLPGTETIRQLKKLRPDIEVIIFTGNPTFESSLEAIHESVFDYICKPGNMPSILKTVRRGLEHRRLILDNRSLIKQLEAERNELRQEVTAAQRALEHRLRNTNAFLGETSGADAIRRQVAKVAPSNVNVLLLGESGTGKDVIAQLIHESSGREPQAFIRVNCPAIPESLLESELFGHEAGSFTGATKRKPGRFELASGGTIFLDEIGDLPFSLQSKLLQSVEQKQFYSVGGKKPIHVDVRIIAATNAPLLEMIDSGKFRSDLYYRLSEYTIQIPPLRERKEDIGLLADHFLSQYKAQFECPERMISPDARATLLSHSWPGNIRELQSVIRRFALTGMPDCIMQLQTEGPIEDVDFALQEQLASLPSSASADLRTILKSLHESKWNRRTAAQKLGMSYSTLRRRISQYNLTGDTH